MQPGPMSFGWLTDCQEQEHPPYSSGTKALAPLLRPAPLASHRKTDK